MCAPPLDDAADLALEALVDALVEALIQAQPEEVWAPVQRWRAAEEGDAESCMGPASVWDMALLAAVPQAQGDLFGGTEHAPAAPAGKLVQDSPHHKTVETVKRMKGRTVVSGLAYPGNRWTEERAAWERARRKMQTVPKPSQAAREFRVGKGAAA